MSENAPLLTLEEVSYGYSKSKRTINGISLDIASGSSFGLIGESGSGKSTILKLMLGLLTPDTGSVKFNGTHVNLQDSAIRQKFRSQVQVVFQDPYSSLDPKQRINKLVGEPLVSLKLARFYSPEADRKAHKTWVADQVARALQDVGLPTDIGQRYPHEFSGGQRQRIAIARAIVSRPRLLLADEPVSALDAGTRELIVELLASLRRELNLSLFVVSHDLSIIAALCEKVGVLQHGALVEQGAIEDVLRYPQHTYSQSLLRSLPRLPRVS